VLSSPLPACDLISFPPSVTLQNKLQGPLPPSLGNCQSLRQLVLSENKLDGPLPPTLSRLSHLEQLWVYANHLTGSLDIKRLGKLKDLQVGLSSAVSWDQMAWCGIQTLCLVSERECL
jgi:Leucine-rich repeat (LRR) protein